MIRAILFDLDDTLLNHKDASISALREFHRRHCADIPWEEIQERWNSSIRFHFERYVLGELTYQQQRRCRVRDVMDSPELPDELADSLFSAYLSEYEKNYSLFPEVRGVLDSLSMYPMGVITNGETRQQHGKLERTGIRSRFQVVLVSDEIGVRKPVAGIFRMAADGLKVSPEECLFIGDNLDADYFGSQAAGMNPVLMDRRGKMAPIGIRSIRSCNEIPGIVAELSNNEGRA